MAEQCDQYPFIGSAVSPTVNMAGYSSAYLTYRGWQDDENCGCIDSRSCSYDASEISVSSDGVNWLTPPLKCNIGDNGVVWNDYAFDISSYAGGNVYVRVRYDTVDGSVGRGIAFDNICINVGNLATSSSSSSSSSTIFASSSSSLFATSTSSSSQASSSVSSSSSSSSLIIGTSSSSQASSSISSSSSSFATSSSSRFASSTSSTSQAGSSSSSSSSSSMGLSTSSTSSMVSSSSSSSYATGSIVASSAVSSSSSSSSTSLISVENTFYFNAYSSSTWNSPADMVDSNSETFSSTPYAGTSSWSETLSGNTVTGDEYGTVDQVYINMRYDMDCYGWPGKSIILFVQPPGFSMHSVYNNAYSCNGFDGWTGWIDITSRKSSWTWSDVANMDAQVYTDINHIDVGRIDLKVVSEGPKIASSMSSTSSSSSSSIVSSTSSSSSSILVSSSSSYLSLPSVSSSSSSSSYLSTSSSSSSSTTSSSSSSFYLSTSTRVFSSSSQSSSSSSSSSTFPIVILQENPDSITSSGGTSIYATYTKPLGATGAIWQYRIGEGLPISNWTVSSDCWSRGGGSLNLLITSSGGSGTVWSRTYCISSGQAGYSSGTCTPVSQTCPGGLSYSAIFDNNWDTYSTYDSYSTSGTGYCNNVNPCVSGGNAHRVYEEAMWWIVRGPVLVSSSSSSMASTSIASSMASSSSSQSSSSLYLSTSTSQMSSSVSSSSSSYISSSSTSSSTSTSSSSSSSSFVSSSSSSSINSQVTVTTLVGYWKFDEGSGTTVSDSAGSNNGYFHGSGGSITWASSGCVSGSCLVFPYAGDREVYIPHSVLLNGRRGTFSLWLKRQDWYEIGGKLPNANNVGYYFDLIHTNQVRFSVGGDSVVSSQPVTSGIWTHLLGTYNESETRLYIDGEPAGSASGGNKAVNSTYYLVIGGNDDGSYYLDIQGMIDEVRYYNYQLSPTEVRQLYQSEGGQIASSKSSSSSSSTSRVSYITSSSSSSKASSSSSSTSMPVRIYQYQENSNELSAQPYYLYLNYTKPAGSIGAIWQAKHASLSTYNLSIPSGCWNAYGNKISLRIYSLYYGFSGGSYAATNLSCSSGGSNWIQVGQYVDGGWCAGWSCTNSTYLPAVDGDWSTRAFDKQGTWCVSTTGCVASDALVYEEAVWWDKGLA